MNETGMLLFALETSRDFGERVAAHLGSHLSPHKEREYEGGEHKARPLVNVRGRDVYVIQWLHGDDRQTVHDKLCRLLFFIGALKDASAERVTAVVPYLCYARKDRKTQPRDPVTTRYIAALFEAVGTDRVVTLDVHNLAAFQNAFRCRTDHLEARKLFIDYFTATLSEADLVVISPDVGGMKRAESFRDGLSRSLGKQIPVGFMEKQRVKGTVSGETLFAEVEGRSVIIIDDLISTGTTILRAARACRDKGARRVLVAASHGVFSSEANDVLADAVFEKIVITDTLPPLQLAPEIVRSKLVILNAAALFAAAIERIHNGGSIAELLAIG
ncbi:MAG: ribose-phosphate pyrophosphokinae [Rhodospirillaceae bacterium]|jgi:ribose-phosphate pyrophosphokinase|nr:ribose-phosphate pyrophosphokinae [Rhodospirillaceae bacterium]